jgi:hypothetical protein
VTFLTEDSQGRIESEPPEGSPILWLTNSAEGGASTVRHPFGHGGIGLQLSRGDYLAALQGPSGAAFGAVHSISVNDDPLVVLLTTSFSFRLDARLLDLDSGAPVPFAGLQLDRVGLPSDWKATSLEATSDAEGFVRVAGLSPGRWRIRCSRDGYVTLDEELILPFNEAEDAVMRREGALSLGEVFLAPVTPIQFQLVDADDWADLSTFKIAHTHEGEPTTFNSSGRALLTVGDYTEPIYLKLWYPDDRMAVFYLNNGVPGPDDVQMITVGGKRTLEVDVQIADDLLEELADRNCGIRVAFRTSEGEDKFIAREIPAAPGVFEFTSVQSPVAMVNFVTTEEGQIPVDWATRLVEMQTEGRTTATLVVERAPRKLRFSDQEGVPLAGVSYRMYQHPNRTTWVIGAFSDEDGEVEVPYIDDSQGLVTARTPGDTHIAFDVPVDLSQGNLDPHLVMSDGALTFVDVTCENEPLPGIWCTYFLAKSKVYHVAHRSDENGRTHGFHLHPASQVEVMVDDRNLWAPVRQVTLEPGRNEFRVWKMGELRLPGSDFLTSIQSAEFAVSLATWVEGGLASITALPDGGISLRLPAGSYRHQVSEQRVDELTIVASESLDLR